MLGEIRVGGRGRPGQEETGIEEKDLVCGLNRVKGRESFEVLRVVGSFRLESRVTGSVRGICVGGMAGSIITNVCRMGLFSFGPAPMRCYSNWQACAREWQSGWVVWVCKRVKLADITAIQGFPSFYTPAL